MKYFILPLLFYSYILEKKMTSHYTTIMFLRNAGAMMGRFFRASMTDRIVSYVAANTADHARMLYVQLKPKKRWL